jgi:hypothetical protein
MYHRHELLNLIHTLLTWSYQYFLHCSLKSFTRENSNYVFNNFFSSITVRTGISCSLCHEMFNDININLSMELNIRNRSGLSFICTQFSMYQQFVRVTTIIWWLFIYFLLVWYRVYKVALHVSALRPSSEAERFYKNCRCTLDMSNVSLKGQVKYLSVSRQVHSLFQTEFSKECDLELPPSTSSTFLFP